MKKHLLLSLASIALAVAAFGCDSKETEKQIADEKQKLKEAREQRIKIEKLADEMEKLKEESRRPIR